MTLARARSVALLGVQGRMVDVEADLAQGLPIVTLVGLPDAALAEARDRIRAAVVNSGFAWPSKRITLGLSPADLRKGGSGFDLPLAIAVLCAAGECPRDAAADLVLIGELGLDGKTRPVRGALPSVDAAARAGARRVIVPSANIAEATIVPGIEVIGVSTLAELVGVLKGALVPDVHRGNGVRPELPPPRFDLVDVSGQAEARRAVEIAAAGAHHLFLLGSPGAGKTMLAERLPGLLPPLDFAAAMEVTAVHSVAGILLPDAPLVVTPPFQAPHHTASVVSLVGGGSGMPRPGAASCAHRGVLFLDEAPQFAPVALDTLRQPMESGALSIARAAGTFHFPARFQLVLAANPCPCASPNDSDCRCAPLVRRRYLARLSGPLMDRIDLKVVVQPVGRADLDAAAPGEPSAQVASRVAAARAAAIERLSGTPWRTNAEVPGPALRTRWRLPRRSLAAPYALLERGILSARGLDRVLRVAWTIADLAGRAGPDEADVAEALRFRVGDGAP
ncbi:MAG: YifB family Mg chelatase-like AAA ATPase [Mycobacteriales bacterium]